jgi:hypothetical protein
VYRGINDFKKGYQPRTNIVKDEKDALVTDSNSILNRWRNHFSQLLNVYEVNDVVQTEIHTAEPLVPVPSAKSQSLYLFIRRLIKQTVIIIQA